MKQLFHLHNYQYRYSQAVKQSSSDYNFKGTFSFVALLLLHYTDVKVYENSTAK